MTADEQLLAGQNALLDLVLGPVEREVSTASPASTRPAGSPRGGRLDDAGAVQPSTEVVKTSERRLRLMQPTGA